MRLLGCYTGGAAKWAMCRRITKKGDAGSNKGLKRGTAKSLQKNMYRRRRQVAVIYRESIIRSKCNCNSGSSAKMMTIVAMSMV